MHARMSVNPATATASNQISKFSVSNYRAHDCRVWPSQLFSEYVHAFEGITPAVQSSRQRDQSSDDEGETVLQSVSTVFSCIFSCF